MLARFGGGLWGPVVARPGVSMGLGRGCQWGWAQAGRETPPECRSVCLTPVPAVALQVFVLLFIFVKRQIMRFAMKSRRGPHVPVGQHAPKVGAHGPAVGICPPSPAPTDPSMPGGADRVCFQMGRFQELPPRCGDGQLEREQVYFRGPPGHDCYHLCDPTNKASTL